MLDEWDENETYQKFQLESSIVKDDFKVNIFNTNYVKTHFTDYNEEI